MVYSKSSYKDFLYQFSQIPTMSRDQRIEAAKKEAGEHATWIFFSPQHGEIFFSDEKTCPTVIFISNASGSHYNLLVPQGEEDIKIDESIQLIVPNEEFKKRLNFYLQKELQLNKERVLAQKHRETIPNFYKYKTNFKKWDNIRMFSSAAGVQEWIRYKTTSKEYLKCLVSPTFRPSETDLARLDFLKLCEEEKKKESSGRGRAEMSGSERKRAEVSESERKRAAASAAAAAKRYLDFQTELLEPYFFHHYKINNEDVSLVQNVLSAGKTFNGNLFQALLVSRIWVLYQVNRDSVEDLPSDPLPDLKWGGLSGADLEREINQKDENQIFEDYNVVVYSPNGAKINYPVNGVPQAYLIQYRGGYAPLLFVSIEK